MMSGLGSGVTLLSELASFSTDGSSLSDMVFMMIEIGWWV